MSFSNSTAFRLKEKTLVFMSHFNSHALKLCFVSSHASTVKYYIAKAIDIYTGTVWTMN